jgi:hypothetical protein
MLKMLNLFDFMAEKIEECLVKRQLTGKDFDDDLLLSLKIERQMRM